jgi:hypothetical protein
MMMLTFFTSSCFTGESNFRLSTLTSRCIIRSLTTIVIRFRALHLSNLRYVSYSYRFQSYIEQCSVLAMFAFRDLINGIARFEMFDD